MNLSKKTAKTLLCVFFLVPCLSLAQSFEGTITYLNDFDLPKSFIEMGLTKEMMRAELNKKGGWFDTVFVSYKKDDYIFLTNAKLKKIYKAADNKIYTFDDPESGKVAVQDAVDLTLSGEPDKPTVTELDSTATIMGLTCKIIRMKWELGLVDYYYHPDQAKVDPSLFTKHTYEGFHEFVSRTKCLPLQIVRGVMGMTLLQTAVSVKSHPVRPDVFSIPTLTEDASLNEFKIPGIKMMRVKN